LLLKLLLFLDVWANKLLIDLYDLLSKNTESLSQGRFWYAMTDINKCHVNNKNPKSTKKKLKYYFYKKK